MAHRLAVFVVSDHPGAMSTVHSESWVGFRGASRWRVAVGSVAASAVFAVPLIGAGAQSAAALAPVILGTPAAFDVTGAVQQYVVPANVYLIQLSAVGGSGGGFPGGTYPPDSDEGVTFPAVSGGSGAVVTAEFAVTPGETITVDVGGSGGVGVIEATAPGGYSATAPGGAGGFHGAAHGYPAMSAGGGGGATTLTFGNAASPTIIAGGGGGIGSMDPTFDLFETRNSWAGGSGGSAGFDGEPAGQDGGASTDATPAGGGAASANSYYDSDTETTVNVAAGAAGANGEKSNFEQGGGEWAPGVGDGGGGGGGWQGGLGGAKSIYDGGGGGGGGAGGSYVDPSALISSITYSLPPSPTGTNGSVTIYALQTPPAFTSSSYEIDGFLGTSTQYQFAAEVYPSAAAPPTYSITDGNLPPGFTLTSDGLFSGTPIELADYEFQVSATNAWGTSTQTVDVSVQPALPPDPGELGGAVPAPPSAGPVTDGSPASGARTTVRPGVLAASGAPDSVAGWAAAGVVLLTLGGLLLLPTVASARRRTHQQP